MYILRMLTLQIHTFTENAYNIYKYMYFIFRQYLIVVICYSREYTSCPILVKLQKRQNLKRFERMQVISRMKIDTAIESNTAHTQTYIFMKSTSIFFKSSTKRINA